MMWIRMWIRMWIWFPGTTVASMHTSTFFLVFFLFFFFVCFNFGMCLHVSSDRGRAFYCVIHRFPHRIIELQTRFRILRPTAQIYPVVGGMLIVGGRSSDCCRPGRVELERLIDRAECPVGVKPRVFRLLRQLRLRAMAGCAEPTERLDLRATGVLRAASISCCMTRIVPVDSTPDKRAYGWDVDTYLVNKSEPGAVLQGNGRRGGEDDTAPSPTSKLPATAAG